jgi:predicted component of type VI protein secretion system
MSNLPPKSRKSHKAGQPAAGKHVSLRVLSPGRRQGQLIPIKVSRFFIGRHPDCHLRPLTRQAALRQAALVFGNGSIRIQNLAGRREVLVNGRPAGSDQELHEGDHLKIGQLRFEVVFQAQSPRTQPPAEQQLSIDEETVGALLLAIQDEPRTISLSPKDDTETTKVTTVARATRPSSDSAILLDDSDGMVWAARSLLQRYNNPRLRQSRSPRPKDPE